MTVGLVSDGAFASGADQFEILSEYPPRIPHRRRLSNPAREPNCWLARAQKKTPPKGGVLILARPAGFEPTTPWFVAKYSIHLSYGRIVKAEL